MLVLQQASTKLPRHCARHHPNEALIAEAIAVPPENTRIKRDRWIYIRNLGVMSITSVCIQVQHVIWLLEKDQNLSPARTACISMWYVSIVLVTIISTPYGFMQNPALKGRKVRFNQSCKRGEKVDVMPVPSIFSTSPASDQQDQVLLIIRGDHDTLKVGESNLSTINSSKRGDKAREKLRLLAKLLQKVRKITPVMKL